MKIFRFLLKFQKILKFHRQIEKMRWQRCIATWRKPHITAFMTFRVGCVNIVVTERVGFLGRHASFTMSSMVIPTNAPAYTNPAGYVGMKKSTPLFASNLIPSCKTLRRPLNICRKKDSVSSSNSSLTSGMNKSKLGSPTLAPSVRKVLNNYKNL